MIKPRCYECLKEYDEGSAKCPHCGKPIAPGGPIPGPHGAGPQGVDVIFPGPHGATPAERAPQPEGVQKKETKPQEQRRVVVPGPHGAGPQKPDIVIPGPHGAGPAKRKKTENEEDESSEK